jgi:hypothetical protein
MPSAGKRKKLHAMSKDIPEMFDPMSFLQPPWDFRFIPTMMAL